MSTSPRHRRARVRSPSWADGTRPATLATGDIVSAEGVVGRTEDLPTARGGIAAFSAGELRLRGGRGGPERHVRGRRVHRRVRDDDTLPGLDHPRHGLGAVFWEGRAYALLGGPRPGLSVSGAVEALDLR